jgi:hypothetical protein
MRGRARWCCGASLAPEDSIGTNLIERGSTRCSTDGEEDSGGEAVSGGADERLPEWNIGLMSGKGQRGSSQYSWLGWRSMGDGG